MILTNLSTRLSRGKELLDALRDYVKTLWYFVHVHGDDGLGSSFDVDWSVTGGTAEELAQHYQLRQSDYDPYIALGWTITFTITDQRSVYFCLDKPNLARVFWLLQDFFWFLAITGVAGDGFPALTNQSGDSPRSTGFKDWQGNKRVVKTELKVGKTKGTTISGIFIIVRNGLYFAGFEGGTGDPVFVRFLFGLTSAHLYLTDVQANQDAARIRKIYKRPDIPVEVVEI